MNSTSPDRANGTCSLEPNYFARSLFSSPAHSAFLRMTQTATLRHITSSTVT
jgi:hypothetical protein